MLTGDATALLQAEAFVRRKAIQAVGRRHLRVDDAPLVLVPLSLAGEDGALLAVALGYVRGEMEVLVCPEPRDRTLAFQLLRKLGDRLCGWLDPLAADRTWTEIHRGFSRLVAQMAPQIVVPTPAAATLVRRLAERMAWQPAATRDATVARAGGWLFLFSDRHEIVPLDSMLLVATEAQLTHWVPPISTAEAAHLLALNAALAPPKGKDAIEAAREVENETGSTLTTPEFDQEDLQPAIEAFNEAHRAGAPAATLRNREDAIKDLLKPILARLYAACHDALDRLRSLEAIPSVAGRRLLAERDAFTRHADYLASSRGFARADSLRRGLLLVDGAERELAMTTLEARWFDPLVRAVASVTGEAFDGTLVKAEVERTKPNKKTIERLKLTMRVAGEWRPATSARYELVWDWDERSIGFEVLGYRSVKGDTVVELKSCAPGVQKAVGLAGELAPGQNLAFVEYAREFPAIGIPADVPWMLEDGP